MKRYILLFAILIVYACNSSQEKKVFKWSDQPGYGETFDTDYGYMNRPEDIPDTLADGTPIYWDGSWQSAYLNNRLHIKKDSAGNFLWIARDVTDSEKEWWDSAGTEVKINGE